MLPWIFIPIGFIVFLYFLFILNILIDQDDKIYKWYSLKDFGRWFIKALNGK